MPEVLSRASREILLDSRLQTAGMTALECTDWYETFVNYYGIRENEGVKKIDRLINSLKIMITFQLHFSTLRQSQGDNDCHGELVEPCLYHYETIISLHIDIPVI